LKLFKLKMNEERENETKMKKKCGNERERDENKEVQFSFLFIFASYQSEFKCFNFMSAKNVNFLSVLVYPAKEKLVCAIKIQCITKGWKAQRNVCKEKKE
jgi:hypothetical protein